MHFLSRRLVMPNDLNYANSLFGGRALEWIDEEAAIYAICQLDTNCLGNKSILVPLVLNLLLFKVM